MPKQHGKRGWHVITFEPKVKKSRLLMRNNRLNADGMVKNCPE
jgi:hypothetical protein